jgi:hypothetical protein
MRLHLTAASALRSVTWASLFIVFTLHRLPRRRLVMRDVRRQRSMQSTEPDKPANPVHHGMRAVITVALFGSAVLLLLAMLLPQLARSKGGPATGCPANLRAIYLAKAVLADDRKAAILILMDGAPTCSRLNALAYQTTLVFAGVQSRLQVGAPSK